MNNGALEYLIFREASEKRLVFHDRTTQAFFAACWVTRFSSPEDRQLLKRDSAALNFDLGAAAYKAGDYDKAIQSFSKAMTSPDPALHAAAEYNLGNALFQQGAALPEKDRRLREWKS